MACQHRQVVCHFLVSCCISFIVAFTMRQSLTCLYVVLVLFGEQLDLEFAHAAI